MAKITDKIKDKVTDAKDKIVATKNKAADKTEEKLSNQRSTEATTSYTTTGGSTKHTTTGGSTKHYEAKEPMSPAKISEHEPTAVKREMTEKITENKGTSSNSEEAKEKARRSGMTKGTAGA